MIRMARTGDASSESTVDEVVTHTLSTRLVKDAVEIAAQS